MKAGLSNSGSKIRRISKNISRSFAVGHRPATEFSPTDEKLFRAFQSNLLSLISHELKTPLMGVLNALALLDGGEIPQGFTTPDVVSMARRNAQRLNNALSALLDLAAIESGSWHARLRELELAKLVLAQVKTVEPQLRDKGLATKINEAITGEYQITPILGDAQKISRAIELILQIVLARAESLKVRITSGRVEFCLGLSSGGERSWDEAWSQAKAGYESGVASSGSLFSGVLQPESSFLSRLEEGLGGELLIVHEIMRIHEGKVNQRRNGKNVKLTLEFQHLSSEEGLQKVLKSRAYMVSNELGSVALALIDVPANMRTEHLSTAFKKKLFRTTDAVYPLPSMGLVAIVLDDCKAEDVQMIVKRISGGLKRRICFGVAHCPVDSMDPADLTKLAQRRLMNSLNSG
ncbi:MAG: histidine kinase dimerization/phospho-acceptor domain-containing protein [Bdellovibrionota bacterium]